MKLKVQDYVLVSTIALTPFLFLLMIFKHYFSDKIVLDDNIFSIIVIIIAIILLIGFIISLFYLLDDIIYRKKNIFHKIVHLINLFIFNILYIPVYYIKFILNKNILYGLVFTILDLFLINLSFNIFSNNFLNYTGYLDKKNFVLKEDYYYNDLNHIFRIKINQEYVCRNDMGDYAIACDNKLDDSFIGIYSYSYDEYKPFQIDAINSFHLLQTENYIKEAGYDYQIMEYDDLKVLLYNDLVSVLYKVVDYDINNDSFNDYRLIIIKEVLYNDNIIGEFNELITNIEFNKQI